MNEYLVTGGLGFIGSHLVEGLLQDENNRVWVIDDGSNACWNPRRGRLDADEHIRELLVQLMGAYEVEHDSRNPRLVCISGDCAHSNILDLIRHARFSCVFHLAGSCSVVGSINEPLEYLEQNMFKTLKIAKACAEGQTRLVFSSSASVYGNTGFAEEDDALLKPANPYGATKYSTENWLRMYRDLYGLDYVSLRYFNAYGPRQRAGSPYAGVIANWVHNIWMSKPCIVYGDGSQSRDFVHVSDIVRANIKSIDVPTTGFHTYNICSERGVSLNDVLNILQKITRHSFSIKYEDARDGEVKHSRGNNTRALVSLEWEPSIRLYEGLETMLKWRGVDCKID